MVIIVHHIHTLTRAFCAGSASLQSAAVQACYTRARFVHTRMSQSGPRTKRACQLGSFFCNTCVASNVTTAGNAPICVYNYHEY